MRLSLAVAALATALTLCAGPADAAGLSGMGKNIFGDYFKFPKANLQSVPVGNITLGKMKIDLQHTKLQEVKKTYGGTIQSQGEGGDSAHWLCYWAEAKDGAANVWLISNIQGGGEFIMMVAAQLASKPAGDCETAPAGFALPIFGIPSLGAPAADLKAKFGAARTSGAISYRADEPAADALGTALNVQYIGYMMNSGKVAGIGVGEGPAQMIK